jgi:hypothetical protein
MTQQKTKGISPRSSFSSFWAAVISAKAIATPPVISLKSLSAPGIRDLQDLPPLDDAYQHHYNCDYEQNMDKTAHGI